MANNYLEFSECIEELTDEEIAFFDACFKWEPPYNEDHELPEDFEWPAWYDQDAESVGFDYDLDRKARTLDFYGEEYGNVDTVGALVHEFIVKFRPDFVFHLTFAETCSKLRTGEFGGGALVVSKYGIEWVNAHQWATDKEEEIRKRMKEEK